MAWYSIFRRVDTRACRCTRAAEGIGVQDALVGNEALARTTMSEHFGCALTAAQGTRGRHALYALRSMALVQAGKPALALKVRRCASMTKRRVPTSHGASQDACAAVAFASGFDAELVLAAHAAAAEAMALAEPVRACAAR